MISSFDGVGTPGRRPKKQPHNKALHQTKGARSGRFAAGHPEAPFAGEGRCSADLGCGELLWGLRPPA